MLKFNKPIGEADHPTPDDLRQALTEARDDLERAQRAHEELAAKRGAVLLDGDDAELDALETDLRQRARDIERCEVAIPELARRLHEAEVAEEEKILDAMRTEGLAESKRGAELIDAYAKHARPMVEILKELEKIRRNRDHTNTVLAAAGKPADIPTPEESRKLPSGHYRQLAAHVVLPDPEVTQKTIWPVQPA